jgi:hypothetical protein
MTLSPSPPPPQSPSGSGGRPNPKLAKWLSIFLPGAGQIYLGSILLGILFMGGWIVACLGMMDLQSSVLKARSYWGFLVLADIAVGVGSWILALWHASAKAEKMAKPGTISPWLWQRHFIRLWVFGEWMDILLAIAYLIVAVGMARHHPFLTRIGDLIGFWWVYEMAGIAFLVLYMGATEGFNLGHLSPLKKIASIVTVFAAFTIGLWLMFHIPMKSLLVCAAILLPNYILSIAFADPPSERKFLYRGGRGLATFFMCGIVAIFFASVFEQAGMAAGRRKIFDFFFMIIWGALHFLLRGLMEAFMEYKGFTKEDGDIGR